MYPTCVLNSVLNQFTWEERLQPLRRGAEQGKQGDDEEELLTENI